MSAEGLLWYDPAIDGFRRPPGRTALDHAHVQAIDDDGAGGLWVGSDIGLVHLRGGDHAVGIMRGAAARGLPAGDVQTVHRDRAGVLWAASGPRVFRRDPQTLKFQPVVLAKGGLDGAITAAMLIIFLGRLIRDAGGKVFLILDRLRVHRAHAVRD